VPDSDIFVARLSATDGKVVALGSVGGTAADLAGVFCVCTCVKMHTSVERVRVREFVRVCNART
jgi:hypothetical protein